MQLHGQSESGPNKKRVAGISAKGPHPRSTVQNQGSYESRPPEHVSPRLEMLISIWRAQIWHRGKDAISGAEW